MTVCSFFNPLGIARGDRVYLIHNCYGSNISEFRWRLYDSNDALRWESFEEKPVLHLDDSLVWVEETIEKKLELRIKVGNSYKTCTQKVWVFWPDYEDFYPVYFPELELSNRDILAFSPPIIKISHHEALPSKNSFFLTPGSNFRVSFNSDGEEHFINFIRILSGLQLTNGEGQSTEECSMLYPMAKTISTINIFLDQENNEMHLEEGYSIQSIVGPSNEDLGHDLVHIQDGRLFLSNAFFSKFTNLTRIEVTLVKEQDNEIKSILSIGEVKKTGTLFVQYGLGTSSYREWVFDNVSVNMAIPYDRASIHYMEGNNKAYFRTKPDGKVFSI